MNTGELYIILGCFGRTDDGFVSCSGIENIILKLNPIYPLYNDIMDYLDMLKLFDRQIMDYNATRHFIYNMQNKFDLPTQKLWSEKMFTLYQKFIIDHKDCGVFIKLTLPLVD